MLVTGGWWLLVSWQHYKQQAASNRYSSNKSGSLPMRLANVRELNGANEAAMRELVTPSGWGTVWEERVVADGRAHRGRVHWWWCHVVNILNTFAFVMTNMYTYTQTWPQHTYLHTHMCRYVNISKRGVISGHEITQQPRQLAYGGSQGHIVAPIMA